MFASIVVLGQAAPTSDPAAGWATLIAQLGLSGVFLYLYSQERKERIRLQDAAAEIAKLAYPLLATVGKALENVEHGLSVTARQMPEDAATDRHALALMMDAIAAELKGLRSDRREPS